MLITTKKTLHTFYLYFSYIISLSLFLKQDNLLSLELSFAKIISFNRNELLL